MTTIKLTYADGTEFKCDDEIDMDSIVNTIEKWNQENPSNRVIRYNISGDACKCFPGMVSRTIIC